MSALFFIAGFGFLSACRHAEDFCRSRSWGGSFGALLVRETEVLIFSLLLLAGYQFVLLEFLPDSAGLFPLLFLTGAFLIRQLRGRDEFFLWQIYALCLLATVLKIPLMQPESYFQLFKITVLTFLFTAAMLGLRRRLLYSNLPQSAAGLPVYFLCAAVLALFLWLLQGIVS